MPIRLIALDLDGTLLDSNKHVSPKTRTTIEAYARRGIYFAFATGRIKDEMRFLIHDLPFVRYAITTNGAYVRDLHTDTVIAEDTLDMEEVRTLYEKLRDIDLMFEIYADGKVLVNAEQMSHIDDYTNSRFHEFYVASRTGVPDFEQFIYSRTKGVGKVNLHFRSDTDGFFTRKLTAQLPFNISYQNPRNLEFNRIGVNKGSGLLALAKVLGLGVNEIMAIGDNQNDLPMLKAAGIGVAMANSTAETLSAADHITLSNDEDGVVAAIEYYLK